MAAIQSSPPFPADSLPILIPPQPNPLVTHFEDGKLSPPPQMSPRSAFTILSGAMRSTPLEKQLELATHATKGALSLLGQADRTCDDLQTQLHAAVAQWNTNVVQHARWQQETDKCHGKELADLQWQLEESNAARNLTPNVPKGYEENHGQVLDFIVHYCYGSMGHRCVLGGFRGLASELQGGFWDAKSPRRLALS